jgi:hypothetical protein
MAFPTDCISHLFERWTCRGLFFSSRKPLFPYGNRRPSLCGRSPPA